MSFLQCLGLFFVIMLPALDLHLTFFGFRFLLGVYASWSVYSLTLLRHCGMSRISLSLRRVSFSIYNLNYRPTSDKGFFKSAFEWNFIILNCHIVQWVDFFAIKINPVFKNPGINMSLRTPDQTDSHFITFQFVYYDRSTDLEFEVKIQNDPN